MITRESWSAGLPVLSRPLVMGVVNVTPDSFSDGGEHATTDAAIAHGLLLRALDRVREDPERGTGEPTPR